MKNIKLVNPVIDSFVFAINSTGYPTIWCEGMNWNGQKHTEFVVITKTEHDTLFMSKDDGSFGDDFIETFDTWEDARECFEKFYK